MQLRIECCDTATFVTGPMADIPFQWLSVCAVKTNVPMHIMPCMQEEAAQKLGEALEAIAYGCMREDQ